MTTRIVRWAIVCLALFPAWLPARSLAFESTKIRGTGSSENRVNLVILGDGYTAGELQKFSRDADNVVQRFFEVEPFKEYQNYFNVYRIDVASNQSGADIPPTVYVDTAFDAAFWCQGIERLLCVNQQKVNAVLDSSLLPNQRDIVLVLVNSTNYGGSGGSIAVATNHSLSTELARHEIGHSFGWLADEYDSSPPDCDTAEPPEANVTAQTNRSVIKWNIGGCPPTGWINVSTAIPTATTTAGIPGLYQGAKYCGTGLYRPTYNSKMRALGYPFEQVNGEQLVLRIYGSVSPVDSFTPTAPAVFIPRGSSQEFRVGVPSPLSHDLIVTWELDNVPVGIGRTFSLSATSPGAHELAAVVRDDTDMVRYDSQGLLTDRKSWKITDQKIPGGPVNLIIGAGWGAGRPQMDVPGCGSDRTATGRPSQRDATAR